MSATIYSLFLFKKLLSIFFSGIIIKMMDDYLDINIDILMGQKNIFLKLDSGGVPYILLLFALACAIDLNVTVTLFLASFALGMMGNLTAKMPLGLYAYQESIMVLLIGFYFFGISEMLSSVFIIAAIQLWDDLLDYNKDIASKKNWAFILGKGECLLLTSIFVLSALYIDWVKALASILFMHVIVYIIHLWLSSDDLTEQGEGWTECYFKGHY